MLKINLKGSVVSTQRLEVALGHENSMASWKRNGLIDMGPKGKGTRGYDGGAFSNDTKQ